VCLPPALPTPALPTPALATTALSAAASAPATLPTTGVAVAGLVAAGQRGPSGRPRAAFVLLSATVLLLAPVRHHWSRRPVDSFPLSYYPMFSSPRGRSAAVVHPWACARTGHGST